MALPLADNWLTKAIEAIGEVLAGARFGAIGGTIPLFTADDGVAASRAAELAAQYAALPGARGRVDPAGLRLDTDDDPAQYRVMFHSK